MCNFFFKASFFQMYVCCVWVYVCANFNQQYLLTTLQKDTFWEMFLSLDLILRWTDGFS